MRVGANAQPLWQFNFAEVTGHNLEARGRKEVNRLLAAGWRLLNVYTLRYEENGVWRERPMAILGRLRNDSGEQRTTESPDFPRKAPQETPALFPIRAKSLGGATHARK
jgi:hypothetical protein